MTKAGLASRGAFSWIVKGILQARERGSTGGGKGATIWMGAQPARKAATTRRSSRGRAAIGRAQWSSWQRMMAGRLKSWAVWLYRGLVRLGGELQRPDRGCGFLENGETVIKRKLLKFANCLVDRLLRERRLEPESFRCCVLWAADRLECPKTRQFLVVRKPENLPPQPFSELPKFKSHALFLDAFPKASMRIFGARCRWQLSPPDVPVLGDVFNTCYSTKSKSTTYATFLPCTLGPGVRVGGVSPSCRS